MWEAMPCRGLGADFPNWSSTEKGADGKFWSFETIRKVVQKCDLAGVGAAILVSQ